MANGSVTSARGAGQVRSRARATGRNQYQTTAAAYRTVLHVPAPARLSTLDRLLLLLVADATAAWGRDAYPVRYDDLATSAGATRRGVRYAVARLVECGIVAQVSRAVGRQAHAFKLDLARLAAVSADANGPRIQSHPQVRAVFAEHYVKDMQVVLRHAPADLARLDRLVLLAVLDETRARNATTATLAYGDLAARTGAKRRTLLRAVLRLSTGTPYLRVERTSRPDPETGRRRRGPDAFTVNLAALRAPDGDGRGAKAADEGGKTGQVQGGKKGGGVVDKKYLPFIREYNPGTVAASLRSPRRTLGSRSSGDLPVGTEGRTTAAPSPTDPVPSSSGSAVPTARALEAAWHAAHVETFPLVAYVKWTRREQGMAKSLATRITTWTAGANVPAFLTWAVTNWSHVVGQHLGWMRTSETPEFPNLRFLVAWAPRFVNAWQTGIRDARAWAMLSGREWERRHLQRTGYSEEEIAEEFARSDELAKLREENAALKDARVRVRASAREALLRRQRFTPQPLPNLDPVPAADPTGIEIIELGTYDPKRAASGSP